VMSVAKACHFANSNFDQDRFLSACGWDF
jgi:hypothetical protein